MSSSRIVDWALGAALNVAFVGFDNVTVNVSSVSTVVSSMIVTDTTVDVEPALIVTLRLTVL